MPENKAVLVGINYINDKNNRLNGCVDDIKSIRHLLHQNGFPHHNMTVLSDDYPDLAGVIYPSRENIIAAFKALIKNAKPGDTLFFHYSGHGTSVPDEDGDEADGMDEALYAADGKEIIDDELKRMIDKLPLGVKLFCLMDCCHSGSILDLTNNLDKEESTRPYEKAHGYVAMISGCQDDQTSADAVVNKKPQGAMTAAFLAVEKELGFSHILKTCFSSSTNQMRALRDKIDQWLKDNDYPQKPNIAYEGTLPNSPILHGYKVGTSSRHLRKVPSRDRADRGYEAVSKATSSVHPGKRKAV